MHYDLGFRFLGKWSDITRTSTYFHLMALRAPYVLHAEGLGLNPDASEEKRMKTSQAHR